MAAASVRGGQHVRSGQPNQDRHAQRELPDGALALAVADGHGGSRHTRAEVGAEIAVGCAVSVLADLMGEGVDPFGAEGIPERLTQAWRQAVEADLAGRPLSAHERQRVADRPQVAYGCTLAVALLGDVRGVVWQVGDGDVVVRHGDGPARRVVPSDPRLVGNATTSMCGTRAELDFRSGRFSCDPPTLVLLATDGYGNAFADDEWPQEVMVDFDRHLRSGGVRLVRDHLPLWLEESAQAGGDDVTVVLAYSGITPDS